MEATQPATRSLWSSGISGLVGYLFCLILNLIFSIKAHVLTLIKGVLIFRPDIISLPPNYSLSCSSFYIFVNLLSFK